MKLILLELLFILFSGYEGIPFDYPYHYDESEQAMTRSFVFLQLENTVKKKALLNN